MSMLSTLQFVRPVLTLFHNPVSSVSVAISCELKALQEWRNPLHQHHQKPQNFTYESIDSQEEQLPFDIEIITNPPTPQQWSVIGTYLDAARPGEGHNQMPSESATTMGPILVDWDAGRVALNNQPLALKLIHDRLNQKI
ncbi:hypothetical protein NADFUDRAFT_52713 [Nadsonia fulvescens var. elongata DSM 6958]|uniref:Uncharacterized protein n=1 Tax=Nadsonia fulvescens var. elongata DSM 6958 TaxID=857566 RepID=A0A1E3PGN8_9ASCO|nr:hypothetical protein NADFUDRAFT_52713 [Nadsonia fulvescens var. elongata DSM 6958]